MAANECNEVIDIADVVCNLSSATDLESIMHIVRKSARDFCKADGVTFILRENDQCYYADEDAITPLWKGQRFPMSACISGWAMLNKKAVAIRDIYQDQRIPIDAYRPTFVKSLYMVPIRKVDPIGAIGVYWAKEYLPTSEQQRYLQAIADVTSVALEKVRISSQLEKRIEELNFERQRLSSIIQGTRVGTWEWNVQTDKIRINDIWAQIIGYQMDELEPVNLKTWESLVHPEDREESHSLLQKHFTGILPLYESEFRMLHKNGEWRWILGRGQVLSWTPEGKPLMMFGTHIDITERKRTYDLLQKSKEQFLNNLPIGVVLFSYPDGLIVDANPAFLDLIGYTCKEEIIGKKRAQLGIMEEPEGYNQFMNEFYQTGILHDIEISCQTKSGIKRTILVNMNLIEFGDQKMILSTNLDISDRKKTEEALRNNDERYKKAQQVGKVGSWEYDIQSGMFWGSEEGLRIYGIDTETDAIPAEAVFSRIIQREKAEFALFDLIKNNKSYDIEFDIIAKNTPERKTIRATAELIFNTSGKPLKATGIVHDITETKRLQDRISQSEKMEAIGALAGGIAHDFNNILGGIIGYADMAFDMLPQKSPLERNISGILKAAGRAKNLVRQILSFSRHGSELKSPQYLSPIIGEVVGLLRASLPSTIDIRDFIAPDTQPVLADQTKVHEIIMNLSTNASYAMHNRGRLEIRYEEIYLQEELSGKTGTISPGWYSLISVKDTGSGMDETTMDRIFEPFFTTKPEGEGTGMGLAVVYGIVQSHNGTITVESAPGMGTTFHIYLPKCSKSVNNDEQNNLITTGGNERILFVDDEDMMCEMCNTLLCGLGYSVTTFNDSISALEYFTKQPDAFDLVITDQTMPTQTGLELAIKLKKLRPSIPILIATGYSKDIDERSALSAGIDGYIDKPYRVREIAAKVRHVLDDSIAK